MNPNHDAKGKFSSSGRQVAVSLPMGRDASGKPVTKTAYKATLANERGPNGKRQIIVGWGNGKKAVEVSTGLRMVPSKLNRDHASEVKAALRSSRSKGA